MGILCVCLERRKTSHHDVKKWVMWQISAVDRLIGRLVDMLRNPPVVREVLKALLVLCSVARNCAKAVEARVVQGLIDILMEQDDGMDESCLYLLKSLWWCAEL